ncbi:MAG: glycosyltransferase family 39 protein [Patescibacteria group bacterium]|nr:glycosyltransferase family 39 protein [Patescibacteria group bacterium]
MVNLFGYRMKAWHILAVILLGATLLRFWGLGTAEIFHDEGFYAFRSIGYLDYVQNDAQTTPVQWFANSVLPWWTHLSFHDHPPLTFLVQHFFFAMMSDSLLVARLPSALAGLGAIVLLYFIARRIFEDERLALLAAAFLAVDQVHLWVSRTALMESLQIAAILASILIFLRFLEQRRRWWLWLGVSLGVCFLIKYTSVFLLPVYAAMIGWHLFAQRKGGEWKSWLGYVCASLAVSAVLFSPVLIYNFYLYRTVGHFDLQFAYLLHQAAPEWQASLGKVQDPFSLIGPNMLAMYSIPMMLLALCGAAWEVMRVRRRELSLLSIVAAVSIFAMLVKVGSAYRFLALLSPFVVLLAVAAFEGAARLSGRQWVMLIAVFFIAYELYFSVDSLFLTFPDFGVVKLDQYFSAQLDDMRSPAPPDSSNPNLEKVIRQYDASLTAAPAPFLIVYDENIDLSERLWLFARRIYYHGAPAVTTGQFKSLLQSRGAEALKGYTIYFVRASRYTSLNPLLTIPDAGDLEAFLQQQLNLKPTETITGYQNLPMFWVYKFTM